ncbi:MAG TPA: glycoside hydrolase, partial [Chitinophagaceae bacterium]|nr:glycoside hydrolase [Chitinophagaceae bacterium]
IMTIGGSWNVRFQPNRGAPANAKFDKLTSYTENRDRGIKYFSGTATYSKTINVPSSSFSKANKTFIDLGDVMNLAEVNVNGKSLGIVWKQPYRVDVSNALKPGENKVIIKVINLWVNRLIGDMQPGMNHKITFTSFPLYRADSKLQPSGLLGPVKIISVSEQ